MISQTLSYRDEEERRRENRRKFLARFHARRKQELAEVESWIPDLDGFKRMLVLYNLDR